MMHLRGAELLRASRHGPPAPDAWSNRLFVFGAPHPSRVRNASLVFSVDRSLLTTTAKHMMMRCTPLRVLTRFCTAVWRVFDYLVSCDAGGSAEWLQGTGLPRVGVRHGGEASCTRPTRYWLYCTSINISIPVPDFGLFMTYYSPLHPSGEKIAKNPNASPVPRL